MLENIVVHSIQVYRVSMCLVDYLKLQGIQMDGQLVQAAALLHDITKTRSFETEENHALTGGQVLTDLGYPEIGNLVRQHVRLDDYSDRKTSRKPRLSIMPINACSMTGSFHWMSA